MQNVTYSIGRWGYIFQQLQPRCTETAAASENRTRYIAIASLVSCYTKVVYSKTIVELDLEKVELRENSKCNKIFDVFTVFALKLDFENKSFDLFQITCSFFYKHMKFRNLAGLCLAIYDFDARIYA